MRRALLSLIDEWMGQMDAIKMEAEMTRKLGATVELNGGDSVAMRQMVEVTKKEASRSLDVVAELQVMLDSMIAFRDKEVQQVSHMYKMVEKKAQVVYKLTKQGDKKSVEIQEEQHALNLLTQSTLERVEKTNHRWVLMSYTIVEWWLKAKMSGCKDRYVLMKEAVRSLPPAPEQQTQYADRSPRSPPLPMRSPRTKSSPPGSLPSSPRREGSNLSSSPRPAAVPLSSNSGEQRSPRRRFSDDGEGHVSWDDRSPLDHQQQVTSPIQARKLKGILKNKGY